VKLLLRLIAFAIAIWCWRFVLNASLSVAWSIAIMWGFVALVPLVARAGRRVLDARPQLDRDGWTTFAVHIAEMILLGCAVMVALTFGKSHPIITIPISKSITRPVVLLDTAFVAFTVLNLAISGLGAPFAVALSKKLASGGLYSRTRNPMVLGTLLLAVLLGLWLQSLQVVVWALLWLSPAWLYLVWIYEERELELRFGEPYLTYRRRTPFLFPRLLHGGHRV